MKYRRVFFTILSFALVFVLMCTSAFAEGSGVFRNLSAVTWEDPAANYLIQSQRIEEYAAIENNTTFYELLPAYSGQVVTPGVAE